MNIAGHNYRDMAFATSVLAWLCGCGTSADPAHMAVQSTPANSNFPDALHHVMCVRHVAGREDTSTFWGTLVSDQDFNDALTATLQAAGLAASGAACKYPIDVNVLGVVQYNHMFSMDVTSHLNYKVYDAAGQPVLLETISAAASSDATFGPVRIKRANEGSIRDSISQFLEKLRAAKLSQAR